MAECSIPKISVFADVRPVTVPKSEKLDLDRLVASLLHLWPRLGLVEQRLSLKLYRLLAQGRPVSRATLAQRTGIAIETVSKILDGWPGVFSDQQGRIVGYWGLAVPEAYHSPHRFTIGARKLSAWCAWDTLFLPQLVGREAQVESVTPASEATVCLTVTPERVERVDPEGSQMSFLLPDTAAFQKDVVTSFCHFVHFFPSRQSGQNWTAQHPGTFLLSIDQAYFVARRRNEALYSAAFSVE